MLSTRLVKNYKLTSVLSAAHQGRSLLKKTSIKMDKNIKVNFEYKKIGNKYTLFSVGIDGIPNTADDIYPNIFDSDSSKFGFMK